ncbi:MAG: TSUP family transporter [Alphaproteobacteria bacterium]
MFQSMPWVEFFSTYGTVLSAILFGAFAARSTGVGFALVVVAALLALPNIDQPTALFIAAPLSILNLSFIAVSLYRETPTSTLKDISPPLAAGFLVGFLIGLYVSKAIMLILGLMVVFYTFITMIRPPIRGKPNYMARSDVGGWLTGIMTGALSFPGPPISAFLLARGFIGNPVRVTIALVGLAGCCVRLLIGGYFSTPVQGFSQIMLIGSALIVIGSLAGSVTAKYMSDGLHRILIISMTFLAFGSLASGLIAELDAG